MSDNSSIKAVSSKDVFKMIFESEKFSARMMINVSK